MRQLILVAARTCVCVCVCVAADTPATRISGVHLLLIGIRVFILQFLLAHDPAHLELRLRERRQHTQHTLLDSNTVMNTCRPPPPPLKKTTPLAAAATAASSSWPAAAAGARTRHAQSTCKANLKPYFVQHLHARTIVPSVNNVVHFRHEHARTRLKSMS